MCNPTLTSRDIIGMIISDSCILFLIGDQQHLFIQLACSKIKVGVGTINRFPFGPSSARYSSSTKGMTPAFEHDQLWPCKSTTSLFPYFSYRVVVRWGEGSNKDMTKLPANQLLRPPATSSVSAGLDDDYDYFSTHHYFSTNLYVFWTVF